MAITETTVTTDRARLSYVHLFEAYANKPGQEPKFSATILIPKSDVNTKQRIDYAIEKAKQQGVTKRWNGVMPPVVATSVYDGDGVRPNGEPFGEECKGHWVFTASSKQAPQVVDINLNPIINQTDVYSGCYAKVCVNFFPYNSNGKRGVGIGLNAVQKLDDGEPLGGRVSAAEAFGAPMVSQPAAATQQYTYPASAPQFPTYAAPIQQHQTTQTYIDPITGLPTYSGM